VVPTRSDRAELAKVMRRIEDGDLLIVTRLDRLARSTRDLLNILHQLAEKGAKFKSLHDPWCDTSTPQGELLVTILAGFATFERHLISARTDDGRKRAQARGVRFGRPRKLDAHQRQEAIGRLAKGETLVDVARTFGVDPTTIGRLQYTLSGPDREPRERWCSRGLERLFGHTAPTPAKPISDYGLHTAAVK
jgi:DNA invertase Pin-like site-specific DNA recombinase